MKQFFNEKRIVVVSVLFAIMFFAILQIVGGIDTNYSIVVEYDNIYEDRAVQLFYNTGDGFDTSKCLTVLANDNKVEFVVKYKMKELIELRIDPINRCEELSIESVYFKWFGFKFNEITGYELYTHIDSYENATLAKDGDNMIISPMSEDPYFVIRDNYVQTIKDFFAKIRVCMCIANLLISIIATLVINILYRFKDSKYIIFKNLADIVASVFAIFYILTCLLHKYHNVKFATLTGVLLGYVGLAVWLFVNKLKESTKLEELVNKMHTRIRYGLIPGIYALSVFLMWKILFANFSYLYLVFYFIPIVISAILCKKIDIKGESDNKKLAFSYIVFMALFTWISGQIAGEYGSTLTMLFGSAYGGQYIRNIMMAIASWGIIFEFVSYSTREHDLVMRKRAKLVNKSIIIFMILLFIYEMMNYLLGFRYTSATIRNELVNYCANPTNLLNIFLFVVMYLTIATLINRGTANIVFGGLYIFLFIGNIVKLIFHDTYFTIADIFQLADFFRIAKGYVTIERVALVILLVIVIAIVIYLERKRIKDSLRIKVRLLTFIPLLLLTNVSFTDVKNAKFSDLNIIKELNWLSEREDANLRGIVVYNYFNALKYKEIFPQAPNGYTDELITEYIELFDRLEDNEDTNEDGVVPNVIMVMMESQFELDNFSDIKINEVLDPVTKENKVATLISPRYGGGTASVEFEALTGLSVSFFPGDLIPYTTFFNSTKRELPSIAREFADNGYKTVAVHPNTASFYNRDKVYECMGFDEFVADESFEFNTANCTADGFMKNEELADKIIDKVEEANSNEEPIFLFSVSIEGHREYTSKYTNVDVNIEDDVLTDAELLELNQYAQTVIEDDKFIEELINYVDSTDTPTIVYFFGDHLPKLTAFETYGFVLDSYNKYSTPIVAYSNYKDITIDTERISPNQLAPQVLKDAGINYSSYYDYIYSLREDYPVITKAFVTDNSGLEIYEIIQYDIMYGKKWFYEEKN